MLNTIYNTANALRVYQDGLKNTVNDLNNIQNPNHSKTITTYANMLSVKMEQAGKGYFLGTGASIAEIKRAHDHFTEVQYSQALSSESNLESQHKNGTRIENVITSIDNKGLRTNLTQFFNKWTDLSNNPSSLLHKKEVQGAGKSLANVINNSHNELVLTRSEIQSNMRPILDRVNQLGKEISELNKQAAGEALANPNGIYDKINAKIRELSEYVNVNFEQSEKNGLYNVSVGTMELVKGTTLFSIPDKTSPSDFSLEDTDGHKYLITGGKLRGLMEGINRIDSKCAELDKFADELRTAVNTLHSAGKNGSDIDGVNFFNDDVGANTFALSTEVSGNANEIRTSITGLEGDGKLAKDIAKISESKITGLDNRTFETSFRDFIYSVGNENKNIKEELTIASGLSKQKQAQRENLSNPSMEELMTEIVSQQRCIQAMGMTTRRLDTVLESILGMMR